MYMKLLELPTFSKKLRWVIVLKMLSRRFVMKFIQNIQSYERRKSIGFWSGRTKGEEVSEKLSWKMKRLLLSSNYMVALIDLHCKIPTFVLPFFPNYQIQYTTFYIYVKRTKKNAIYKV